MSEAIVTNGRVEDFKSDLSSLVRRRLPVLCVIAVAVLAISPAIFRGIPSNIDLWNHFRFALPFYDSLQAGHLAPGWLAESNSGFGDPSFRFYPPATYYLLAACRVLTGNWYSASLLLFTLLSIIGGLGIYFWSRAFLPRQLAMWAGIFYTLMPYHVNELYQAFLLAEYAGCAVLPFAFAFVERICQRRRMRDVVGLAASFAILVLTHLPLTVIGGFALFIYGLLRMEKGARWATLQRLALGALLGLATSAFYWVTMLSELHWIKTNTTQSDTSVDYRFNFLFSSFTPDNLNVWWMNILTIASLAMLLPCVAFLRRRAALRGVLRSKGVRVTCALVLFSLFMATPLSRPLWMLLSPLQGTQFPWRWLTVVSMAGSVAAAATIHFWIKKARESARPVALLIAGGVLVSLTLTFSHIVNEARYLTPQQFNATLNSIPGSPSVDYWFTVWAVKPLRGMTERVEAEGRSVKINSWEAESRSFEVTAGEVTEARVRTFYYPYWQATASGRELALRAADDGALLISLPPDAVSVKLEFQEPARVHFAAALSAIGLLSTGALFIFDWRRRR
ncbi:MAG TPA: 6-pyruvoyl-tetrahydropterin synthase-related protein [Pyrinomonadaceae bacterium]|nr:6-pyruvoyl-tetrahydropterin synthase-related protein [Pyrinomonadaceae bacterium]